MNEITKQDLESLTSAMVNGFQSMHDRLDDANQRLTNIEETLGKHGEMIDHIAGRADDLWVEAGAQTQANRRFEARIARLETQMGLSPIEDMIAA
ncbi:hypothetical protein N9491_06045 [Planktomarina temperata]|nr:hypothetical protein [Planktomarina temperata]